MKTVKYRQSQRDTFENFSQATVMNVFRNNPQDTGRKLNVYETFSVL